MAFGILFGAFLLIAAVAAKPSANLVEGLKGVLTVAGGLGVLLAHIYLSRVTIGDDYIEYRKGFGGSTRVPFSDIEHSTTRVLAERSHPLFLDIFSKGMEYRRAPMLRIRLKAFRKADVDWLLSLPELKVYPAKGR